MFHQYLLNANENIENLIDITRLDIEDIKTAQHENIFKRVIQKEEFLMLFSQNKSLVDNELVKLLDRNPNSSLEQLLEPSEQDLLDELTQNLNYLKTSNQELSKLTCIVRDFYNELVGKLLLDSNATYKKDGLVHHSYDISMFRVKV